MDIQWFPGHMAKTRRLLAENLKLVDVAVELLDARIPASSKNPEIDTVIRNKPRIIVLNKSDLADSSISDEWASWYKKSRTPVVFFNSLKGTGLNRLKTLLYDLMKDRLERDKEKGRVFRPIRIMVVGIPNVGKSAFINKVSGRASALTGDKPGVTKGKQWIRLNPEIEMLDTPGILWPKFEDKLVGINLAFTGAIRDETMDITELAARLSEKLATDYPEYLSNRFRLQNIADQTGYQLLEAAGKNRGCLMSGGLVDLERISTTLLDEFRSGKIGRISLERPPFNSPAKD